RLPKIERRAGTVTIASGKARLKRSPRLARASMFGVCIWGEPYAPTWSGRRLSMIRTRTLRSPELAEASSSELHPTAGRIAAPAAPAAPACSSRRRLRRLSTRRESSGARTTVQGGCQAAPAVPMRAVDGPDAFGGFDGGVLRRGPRGRGCSGVHTGPSRRSRAHEPAAVGPVPAARRVPRGLGEVRLGHQSDLAHDPAWPRPARGRSGLAQPAARAALLRGSDGARLHAVGQVEALRRGHQGEHDLEARP